MNGTAETPEQLHQLFGLALERSNLDDLMELFDEEALLVMNGREIRGAGQIRSALEDFISLDLVLSGVKTVFMHRTADVALLASESVVHSRSDGSEETQSFSVEIARRQADGSWKFLVDMPGVSLGGENAV